MARTEGDTWDLANSVGATATMVAAARAAASRSPQPVTTDTSEEGQEQARLMTEGWRRQGLDMDIADLTYAGEHTDVAAHLQANGWETTRYRLTDLFAAAGLPELGEAEHQVPARRSASPRPVRI